MSAPAFAAPWDSLSEDLQRQIIIHCSFDQLRALKAISWAMCRLGRAVLVSEWSVACAVAAAEDDYVKSDLLIQEQTHRWGTCPKLLQRFKPLWKRDPMQFMLGLEFWHKANMAGHFLIAMASRFKDRYGERQEEVHYLFRRNMKYTRRLQSIVCGLQRWRNVEAAGRVLYVWTSFRPWPSTLEIERDMRTLERVLAALVQLWREENMQKAVALVDVWLSWHRESIPETTAHIGSARIGDTLFALTRISDTVSANRRAFMAALPFGPLTTPRRRDWRDWEGTGNDDDRWAVNALRPEEEEDGDDHESDASALSASEASASEGEDEAEDDEEVDDDEEGEEEGGEDDEDGEDDEEGEDDRDGGEGGDGEGGSGKGGGGEGGGGRSTRRIFAHCAAASRSAKRHEDEDEQGRG